MIEEVIKYNCAEAPAKMGTFSQYAYPQAKAKYAAYARAMGFIGKDDDDSVKLLIKEIGKLKKTIGIKDTIKDYGVDEKAFLEKLDEMTEQAFDDQCTGANPRYPLMEEIKAMYLKAYYGK